MANKKVGQSTKRHHRAGTRAEIRRLFGRKGGPGPYLEGATGADFRAFMQRETEKITTPGKVGWAKMRYLHDPKKLPKNVWRTAGRKKKKATDGENKPKRTGIK